MPLYLPAGGGGQPLDSDLTDIAALTPSNDDVMQRKAGAWTNRTLAQVRTDVALVKFPQRITTIVSSATPTVNTDTTDAVTITALATAITSMTTNLTGTPGNFERLVIRIKDDGTARAITWGAKFIARGITLPTTTVLSKVTTVGFIYDTVAAAWAGVAVAQEA